MPHFIFNSLLKMPPLLKHRIHYSAFQVNISIILFLIFSSVSIAETNVAGVEITIDHYDYFEKSIHNPPTQYNPTIDAGLLNEDTLVKTEKNVIGVVPDDLWQRIKTHYAIENVQSPLTSHHENWYASRPDYVARMISRSEKYLFHIVEELERRKMPSEIALLPMIESAYNPQAYSRSHAAGIWQFIPSTGNYFGLKQNWWIDNRRNITVATNAALDYLQKLHNMFGSWDLALAAYNAGEGTVSRAIAYNQSKGLPTTYTDLTLSNETKNYVPKLQAVKNIITDPSAFGLTLQPLANMAYFQHVQVSSQMDTKLVAKLANISFDEFLALNPSYNRPILASQEHNKNEAHTILLPITSVPIFEQNLASYDQPLVSWKTYKTARGENVTTIANKFGMPVSHLRHVNGLSNEKKIKKPSIILVQSLQDYDDRMTLNVSATEPVASKSITSQNKNTIKEKKIIYTIKSGDTLYGIARKFNIAVADIKRWNKALSAQLIPGKKLTIFHNS